MRKWLILLLAISLLYALPKLNTRGRRRDHPLMKRIDGTINVVAAALLVLYLGAFFYWVWTEILH